MNIPQVQQGELELKGGKVKSRTHTHLNTDKHMSIFTCIWIYIQIYMYYKTFKSTIITIPLKIKQNILHS